ncbi:MAG: thioredoxin domain-containing protein [Microbacterium sp.]
MAQTQGRTTNWFAIWISVAVVVVLVVVSILVVVFNNVASAPGQRPAGSGIDTETGAIVAGTGSNQIDIWFDFYCPHCQEFEEDYGPTIDDLLEQGDATVNLFPVALPGLNGASGTDFSKRSANAMYCVAETTPDAAYPFMQALFATNPTGPGQTDDELVSMATDAGAADISSCVADGTYIPFVEEQTGEIPANPTTGGAGTPTIVVNGEHLTLTGDPQADLVDRMN